MKLLRAGTALGAALLMGACVNIPPGPSVMALPGTAKTAEQFRDDDWFCRNFANDHVGGVEPSEVARSGAAKGAVIGTVVGAGLGAAFGGGGGAAIGAGFGLLTGFAVGSGTGENSAYSLQRRYDNAYVQCMYAKGHRVPVSGRLATPPRPSYVPPPPPPHSSPSYSPPPPPRGTPPPPPPSQ